jgi:predicted dehydrogenase
MMWAMNDETPVSAMGTGGRQVRTAEKYGNIFDHFAITYEYKSGVKGFHFSRQQANTENSYKAEVFGTKGRGWADVTTGQHIIEGQNKWEYGGGENDMYQAEHDALFAAIRFGDTINQGAQLADSTMAGIMGRMAAYTGKRVTWEQAINSEQRLSHDIASWNHFPEVEKVAMPGQTPLA